MGLFRKKPAGPRVTELDMKVLEQLEKAGSDLSQPHEVDNFLYFKDQETADKAAVRLRGSSKSVETSPAAKGSEWLTKAVAVVVPTPANIADMRARMEAVARDLQGDYDGWGAPIVPRH